MVELKLYLAARAKGMPVETPAVRRMKRVYALSVLSCSNHKLLFNGLRAETTIRMQDTLRRATD